MGIYNLGEYIIIDTVKELINIAEKSGIRIEQVTTYRDFLEGLEAENIEG